MLSFCLDNLMKLDFSSVNPLCINGFTFDGSYFYITTDSCKCIYVFNTCFELEKEIYTDHYYDNICYDYSKKVFLATSNYDKQLYLLNKEFEISKCIELDELISKYGKIISLCCIEDNKILLVFSHNIIVLNSFMDYKEVYNNSCNQYYKSAIRCSQCLITSFRNNNEDILCFHNSNNQKDFIQSIPLNFCTKNMTYHSCKDEDVVFVLAIKNNCTPYILKYIVKNICHDDNCCFFIDDCCNESCEFNYNCNTSSCNIIESIALIETALSHILNAEGEKIQKALCVSDDICDLLKINASVNQTIKNIIHLEHLLIEKLELSIHV